jgi:hypothetical protein
MGADRRVCVKTEVPMHLGVFRLYVYICMYVYIYLYLYTYIIIYDIIYLKFSHTFFVVLEGFSHRYVLDLPFSDPFPFC